MKSYQDMSDEELIRCLRNGDAEITDFIMDKYKNPVRKRANAMFLIGGETEDLIQEGMIGLFEAIQNYDDSRDMSFHSFADMCVTRQLYSAVKASQRKKHVPLNSYVSLDSDNAKNSDDEGVSLADILPAEKSAEELFIDRENTELIKKQILTQLSKFEQKVLNLYLSGIGYTQIAEILDKDQKSVDNALQRIKTKTKRLFKL